MAAMESAGNRRQYTLFALPSVKSHKLTIQQRVVLDAILLGNGRLERSKHSFSRKALRNAIKAGLVEAILAQPAVYRVTAIGRAVRSNRMRKKNEVMD
jgi:hypothetical protein